MKLFNNIKINSFIVNSLLFVGLILFLLQPLGWHMQLPTEFWIRQAALMLLWVGMFSVIANFLVPSFLFKNKLLSFCGLLIATILLVIVLDRILVLFINYNEVMAKTLSGMFKKHTNAKAWTIDPFMVFATVFIAGISASVEIIKKWYAENESRSQLEQEKIASELSFLKAQINPHFFFNTLNNIYSLNRIDADKAGDAIYTLSHMMRYVLYETHTDTSVAKEVKFIEDYIKLMQLRLTSKVQITFNKPDTRFNHTIAPMLFLPYVENAFKHGLSPTENTSILIDIVATESAVIMEVRNSIVQQQGQSMEESNGIGLVNTKRRLELMYPDKYELNINPLTSENEYVVKLKLNL